MSDRPTQPRQSWSIRVGDVECHPGVTVVRMPVFSDLDGTDISLVLHAIVGREPGPTLAVVAGLHGNEWQSSVIAGRVSDAFDSSELSGALVIAPVANPIALANGTFTARDQAGIGDMVRAFGSNGASMSEQLASALREHLLANADALVDIRGGLWGVARRFTVVVHDKRDVASSSFALAKAFGSPVLQQRPAPNAATSSFSIGNLDIPSIISAIGGVGFSPDFEERLIDENVQGIRNILAQLKIVSARPRPEAPPVFHASDRVRPRSAGMLAPIFEPADLMRREVRAGEVLAHIWNPHTFETIDELRAVRDGLVSVASGARPVRPGDEAYEIVSDPHGAA